MAFKQIKFQSLFALLATSALIASASEAPQEQAAAEAASGKSLDVIAHIQKSFGEIASEARSALTHFGDGVQKSLPVKSLMLQLQGIIKEADGNAKKLAEGIASKSARQRAQELRDSAAVQALVQDFESINSLVANALKKAGQSEAAVGVSENLQNILSLSKEAVGNLKSPQMTGAISKIFDQLTISAERAIDSIRKNPAAQIVNDSAQAIGGRVQKSLSGLTDQVKSGDLRKNVQGYLDGFTSYAKSAADSISNLETVKLFQNGLGSLGFRNGAAAATPKVAEEATEAQQAAPAPEQPAEQ